jgi:LPS-assembly lipoprotein
LNAARARSLPGRPAAPGVCARGLVLCLALVLAGCGFQLRGGPDWPAALDPVGIVGLDPNDPLRIDLVQSLRAAGLSVRDTAEADGNRIRILALREERRVLTVTAGARISEYELTRRLEAELRLAGAAEPVPLGSLEVGRVYRFDPAAVLGQGDREEALRRAMNRDLVRLLQLRVQAAMAEGGGTAPATGGGG